MRRGAGAAEVLPSVVECQVQIFDAKYPPRGEGPLDAYSRRPTIERGRLLRSAVGEFHAMRRTRALNGDTGDSRQCGSFFPGETAGAVHQHLVERIADAAAHRAELLQLVVARLA